MPTPRKNSLSHERSDFYRFGYAMLGLTPMIEDSFALALCSWQTSMIENLHFSTHQDVFFYVPGYALTDEFVLLGSNARATLHLEKHVIPAILSAFKVYLEFATNFWHLR